MLEQFRPGNTGVAGEHPHRPVDHSCSGLRDSTKQAELFKAKINFKYPGAEGFKPHQDAAAGWQAYVRGEVKESPGHPDGMESQCTNFVSVSIALDSAKSSATANMESYNNGPLEILAGEHKRGLLGPIGAPLSEAALRTMTGGKPWTVVGAL